MQSLSPLAEDLRYALRMIRKRPGFAAIAVTVLALGIGANAAVFSIVNGLLLRPLPFPQLDRLVEIRSIDPRRPNVALAVAPADYLDWKQRGSSFQRMSAYAFHDYDLGAGRGNPEWLRGVRVSTDFLATLGVTPALGRDFQSSEDQPGRSQVVLISDSLWRNRFGADPHVVGRIALLDSTPYTVIGVMPAGFEFPFPGMGVWTPLDLIPSERTDRRTHAVLVAARMRDGVSLDQARVEMDAQAARLAKEYAETNRDRGAGVVLLRERQGEISKPFLMLLQATAFFVLLIACANLANLQLA
jgi:predicted permease